jgi:hypothetical protein
LADGIATPPTNKPAAANSATRLVDFNSPPNFCIIANVPVEIGRAQLDQCREACEFARAIVYVAIEWGAFFASRDQSWALYAVNYTPISADNIPTCNPIDIDSLRNMRYVVAACGGAWERN